jgi:hypothetical protein
MDHEHPPIYERPCQSNEKVGALGARCLIQGDPAHAEDPLQNHDRDIQQKHRCQHVDRDEHPPCGSNIAAAIAPPSQESPERCLR